MIKACEIYITSVRYKSQAWFNDPDVLLDEIANYLNDVCQFNFSSISLNMSQVYNVALKNTNYDAMMIYIKGVKCQGHCFLSEMEIVHFRNQIITKLQSIPEFEFSDVQIRSTIKYEYLDLFAEHTKTQKQYEFDRR